MAAVRTLMILLGVFAVLALGAAPMAAMAEAPCHSQPHETPAEAPADPAPSKALKMMGCCVACVSAPSVEPAEALRPPLPGDLPAAASASLRAGLSPRPAHGPPRA